MGLGCDEAWSDADRFRCLVNRMVSTIIKHLSKELELSTGVVLNITLLKPVKLDLKRFRAKYNCRLLLLRV